jgi:hypothetical protein
MRRQPQKIDSRLLSMKEKKPAFAVFFFEVFKACQFWGQKTRGFDGAKNLALIEGTGTYVYARKLATLFDKFCQKHVTV